MFWSDEKEPQKHGEGSGSQTTASVRFSRHLSVWKIFIPSCLVGVLLLIWVKGLPLPQCGSVAHWLWSSPWLPPAAQRLRKAQTRRPAMFLDLCDGGAMSIGRFWGKCTAGKWDEILQMTSGGSFSYFSIIKSRSMFLQWKFYQTVVPSTWLGTSKSVSSWLDFCLVEKISRWTCLQG